MDVESLYGTLGALPSYGLEKELHCGTKIDISCVATGIRCIMQTVELTRGRWLR
jgi:hypothetical protein